MEEPEHASVDLYWLPLGAGGWFVRLNGRVYERVHALVEHREPRALFHTALEVRVPEGRFVVENAWPSPDADAAARGVVREGPVVSRRLARLRAFRYEVRRWPDGVIADVAEAVASPHRLSTDPQVAQRLLDLVEAIPAPAWGRDELGTGEMWNSNSVVAWLLARSGIPAERLTPPAGGRAPGWRAGLVVAARARPRRGAPPHGTSGAIPGPSGAAATGPGAVILEEAVTDRWPAGRRTDMAAPGSRIVVGVDDSPAAPGGARPPARARRAVPRPRPLDVERVLQAQYLAAVVQELEAKRVLVDAAALNAAGQPGGTIVLAGRGPTTTPLPPACVRWNGGRCWTLFTVGPEGGVRRRRLRRRRLPAPHEVTRFVARFAAQQARDRRASWWPAHPWYPLPSWRAARGH